MIHGPSRFLLLVALSAGVVVTGPTGARADAARPKRPNVIVILADDLGYSDVGCYGGEIATPNLDRLAAGGLRFTQFYNTARCWPSRAALLTGYYAQQVNRDPARNRPKWAALLPELLKPAGYRSYFSGKWHVDGPIRAGGFSRSYEVADLGDFFSPPVHRLDDEALPRPSPDAGYYSTTAIATRAAEWLAEHQKDHRDAPFFLYVPFTTPHFPLHALPEDIARYRDRYLEGWDVVRQRRWRKQKELGIYDGPLSKPDADKIPNWNVKEEDLQRRIGPGEVGRAVPWDSLTPVQRRFQATKMALHAAMVDRMDREIGRILDQLKTMGATDDTLILFMSDNGASGEQMIRAGGHDPSAEPGSRKSYLCLGPGWSTASNTPFRLHKYWVHEGGISTPLIAHWPAGIKARGEIRYTPAHLVDLVPTFLELAGLTPPDSHGGEPRPPLSGRSLLPAFAADVTIPRDFLYFNHEGNRALRVGDRKIVAAGADSPWELYDLANDRAESNNLAPREPAEVERLAATWRRLTEEYRKQAATAGPAPSAR